MQILAEIFVSLFLIGGSIFALIGSLGLVKLRDTMQRLHAPTKATTLGISGILIASMLYFLIVKGTLSFHEFLIVFFLFVTAPITANFISKVYIQEHLDPDDLPATESEYGWAVYDEPPQQS